MKQLVGSVLDRYQENLQERKAKAPTHEKAASVNEILKVVPETKIYDYGYWLKKVGSASYSQVLGICKEARGLEKKYNRGGFITNQLKPYEVKPVGARANRRRGAKSTKDTHERKESVS